MKCGGKCCTRFPLSVSPQRMGELYLEACTRRDAGEVLSDFDRDVITIAEMLIPLQQEGDERPTYTCKHHDTVTGLCTIYGRRPALCADYPGYGRGDSCLHCGYHDAVPHAESLPAEVIGASSHAHHSPA